MLFHDKGNGEYSRFTDKEIADYRKQLEEILPHVFSEGSETPLRIEAIHQKKKQVFAHGSKTNSLGTRIFTNGAIPISQAAPFIQNGRRYSVRYSDAYPEIVEKGRLKWPSSQLILEHDMVISPEKDLEKIIFLVFFSTNIQNGKNGGAAAMFRMVIPGVKGKERVSRLSLEREIDDEVVFPKTRMDYARVKKICALLNIPVSASEDNDRLALRDFALSNSSNLTMYYRYRDSTGTDVKANTADLSNINDVVKKAISQKFVRENAGWWCVINQMDAEVMKICRVTGATARDKKAGLVDHLATDPSAMEVINEYLSVPA